MANGRKKSALASLSEWQKENPLLRWRLKQKPEGWKCSVLARQLKVSHTAVGTWERGERLPIIDTFEKIETLTGITTKLWMAWFRKKPKDA